MPSLLKKPGDKAAAQQMAWHPNFRNVEHLPDTKAVRTAFFVNGLAVLLAVILLIHAVYKQYQLNELNDVIATTEQIIAKDKPVSDAAVENFRKFQAAEKEFKIAEGLLESRLVFSDFVFYLGSTLPVEVNLANIDFRGTLVNLSGSVGGSPEKASGMVTAYLAQLRADNVLSQTFGEVDLTNMSRNTAAETISMELVLRFPEPKKKK